MKDEELLAKLAKAMGDEDFLDDPRWARMAAGELSEQEQETLRKDMAARPDALPEKVEAAFETFSPLGPAFQNKIESMFAKAEEPRPSWLSRIFDRPLFPVALAAAAAAAILIAVLWPAPLATLPGYDLVFAGGDRTFRGNEPKPDLEPAELSKGSLLDLRLRPATRVSDVDTLVLLSHLAGAKDSRRLDLPFRVSESGVLTVEGPVERLLPVPAGDYRLVLVVTRKDTADDVPTDAESIVTSGTDAPWQVFVLPLRIVDE
jgi:hypothetical protein